MGQDVCQVKSSETKVLDVNKIKQNTSTVRFSIREDVGQVCLFPEDQLAFLPETPWLKIKLHFTPRRN
jgi:hypothetical protein